MKRSLSRGMMGCHGLYRPLLVHIYQVKGIEQRICQIKTISHVSYTSSLYRHHAVEQSHSLSAIYLYFDLPFLEIRSDSG